MSQNHKLWHSSDLKFKCNVCSRHFPFQSELTSHQAIHLDNKKVKCTYLGCQGKYKTKEEYNRHYKTHRPSSEEHQCPVCNKVFTKKKYLKEHKKAHTGELQFKCDICGDQFRWCSGQKTHMENEHKNKGMNFEGLRG